MTKNDEPQTYGVMAEFGSPERLIDAITELRKAGYREVDAYTPYPIEAVNEALDIHHSPMPKIVLAGGLLGGLGGFSLQYWASVIEYPHNVGGRPFNSWPAFIVPTFECTILGAALSAVIGMLFVNGLPMPHHPVFNAERFAHASRDRYFLVVKAKDKNFDRNQTHALLKGLTDHEVSDVEY